MTRVGLGLRAAKGGAVAVGVTVDAGKPRVLLSTALKTHSDGDRLSLEPYAVAYEIARKAGRPSAQAIASVTEGRKRQDELAVAGLQALVRQFESAGHRRVVAGLLVNRAGWITDLLEYSLAFAEHVPVAEGLAVRQSLRHAIGRCGIEAVELDEKSLLALATDVLKSSAQEIETRVKALGTVAGKPWRKEQKLACLAAWVAAAQGRRRRGDSSSRGALDD